MKNCKFKNFFFIQISLTLGFFAFSCASRPSADNKILEIEEEQQETEDSTNQEISENKENFSDEGDFLGSENLSENETSAEPEDSLKNETSAEQNAYPDIAILQEEPQIFDEVPKTTASEPKQEKLDFDIEPYFESKTLPQTEENASDEKIKVEEEKFDLVETEASENIFDSSAQETSELQQNNAEQSATENSKPELTSENPPAKENSLFTESQNAKSVEKTEISSAEDADSDEDAVESESPVLQITENEISEKNESESQQKEEKSADEILISRSMTMAKNQFLEVKYPGNGWIYLGEENQQNLMRYMGRKIGTSDTIFTLRSRTEGTTVLHFYKNDALTGKLIDDYLEVKIKGKAVSNESAKAPLYEEIVPKKSEFNSSRQNNLENAKVADKTKLSTETENTKSGKTETELLEKTENISSDAEDKIDLEIPAENLSEDDLTNLLENAKTCLENKNFSEALENVNKFLETSLSNLDEALFIKAQILESPSSVRNIKDSLNAYETIVKSYPKSKYWQQANNRATYLKRFFFNIR